MDEHYNYFDDMYSPEYAVNNMIKRFKGIIFHYRTATYRKHCPTHHAERT